MHVVYLIAGILGGFAAAAGLTWAIRNYALRAGMLDDTSARTLHAGRIPRGGGLSIVLIMVAVLALVYSETAYSGVLLTAVAAFALLGWLDDRYDLSPLLRIVCQLAVAVLLVAMLGYFREIEFASLVIPAGAAGSVFTVLWIVWLANGYNFMDGIDGIAASQSAVAACTIGIWFTIAGDHVLALFCYVIMSASLGFLVWNWSPAKIFMGDVGSVTLGAVFAVLALIAYQAYDMPIGAFVILLGVFLFDTTVTLVRRALRGEVLWQAHREHFYQQAVTAGSGHARVTVSVLVLAAVLAVLATLEVHRIAPQPLWFLVAAVVLGAAAWAVKRHQPAANDS